MTRDLVAEANARAWSDFIGRWNERRARERAALECSAEGTREQVGPGGS